MVREKIYFIFTFVFCIFFLKNISLADSPRNLPPKPCDFYGTEETPNHLYFGSEITAKDPNGITIGRYVVRESGRYGFLTTEGARDGDIITFYLNGQAQQKQAIWKSGEIVRVDFGNYGYGQGFMLHLQNIPGYYNLGGDLNYSGVAVADMLLDYLQPANTDTQLSLLAFADLNGDGLTSPSELERLLNAKKPAGYNFSSTSTLKSYSDLGYIDPFNPANQNEVTRQICHWLTYKVPNVASGKEQVPVAVCTSSDPALKAESDFKHWMSVVGIITNQDPFPSLSTNATFREEYRAPSTLELTGVFLNDPGQAGLGFHSYLSAQLWQENYFRPLASGLEGAGTYAAVMEPPSPKAKPLKIIPPAANARLGLNLQTPKKGISIFVPDWIRKNVRGYLAVLSATLNKSLDFARLVKDDYFSKAIKNTFINRSFKVDALNGDDYTIIPFDKFIAQKYATTCAVIMNNSSGQLQVAFADPQGKEFYRPMPLSAGYFALRKEIGWRSQEFPLNFWQSYSTGNPLYPGWSAVTAKYTFKGPVSLLETTLYTISAQKEVKKTITSAKVEVLSARAFRSPFSQLKYLIFKIPESKKYSLTLEKANKNQRAYLWNYADTWLLVTFGNDYAKVKITNKGSGGNIRAGGVSYLYVR